MVKKKRKPCPFSPSASDLLKRLEMVERGYVARIDWTKRRKNAWRPSDEQQSFDDLVRAMDEAQ